MDCNAKKELELSKLLQEQPVEQIPAIDIAINEGIDKAERTGGTGLWANCQNYRI